MVDCEKKEMYEPTVEYFKIKYGLLVDSRGIITKEFVQFCTKITLSQQLCQEIALLALKDYIQILRNHLYQGWSTHGMHATSGTRMHPK